MRAKGGGRIINIAAVHGQVGSVGKAAYVAAKHGVIGLTKVVGLETATSNVTCNAICPGWVLTPLVQKQIDDRIATGVDPQQAQRSEEHTSELQSLMRISYAVFCLKKKKHKQKETEQEY